MARKGGNPNLKGVKGRSGRRPIAEEFKKYATDNYLKEISKSIVARHLQAMGEDTESFADEVKDLALPIVLKDMANKEEHSGTINLVLEKELNGKYASRNPSDSSEGQP